MRLGTGFKRMNVFRQSRRICAVSIAFAMAILLFRSIGDVAHFAVVEHVICSEHGDLLHGSERRFDSHQTEMRSQRPRMSPIEAISSSENHSHDPCAFCLIHREHASYLVECGVACSTSVLEQAFNVSTSHTVVSFFVLYRVAPKQSPPSTIS